ncbi:unnamed protein product [Strongylus vulgaris]|uniref:Uncharacterized protein n=1 Tax=Strongylus vulgaris TaxID=40348 RepID=A0A3P7JHB9_STRVU|nr:unnamed protein product [Strongylus vulgaris]
MSAAMKQRLNGCRRRPSPSTAGQRFRCRRHSAVHFKRASDISNVHFDSVLLPPWMSLILSVPDSSLTTNLLAADIDERSTESESGSRGFVRSHSRSPTASPGFSRAVKTSRRNIELKHTMIDFGETTTAHGIPMVRYFEAQLLWHY